MRIWTLLFVLALVGCHKAGPGSDCKNDNNCKNGVCVFGKCQDCALDTDCMNSKICIQGRCDTPKESGESCLSSNECAGEMICHSGQCTDHKMSSKKSCTYSEVTHFDFDKYDLKSGDKEMLSEIAACMRANPGVKVLLEGHCDERGTVEYNLTLGQKRAQAVKKYLKNSGVDASRMRVVSYGKEKPIDLGNTESAYAKNRRTEISVDN